MILWTDIIDPATLTEYTRTALADIEANKGSLAQWLPNKEVQDIVVRFQAGQSGLVEAAKFRAYDAEIEIGAGPQGKRVTLELPALGMNIPVTEYSQLRARGGNVSDAQVLQTITATADRVARAVADAMEKMRGVVLATGKATIDQDNYQSEDDFGRPAGHTITAPALWSVTATDRLSQIESWVDTYVDANGVEPGAMVMSNRVFRALAAGDQFQTQLLNGVSRPSTEDDVRAIISGAGLPDIYKYDRRVMSGGVVSRALPDDRVILLPAPVSPDDFNGTELGASFWGRTLTSQDADWSIADVDQPGVVTGVYRSPKPPMGVEVIADAIGLPVLANGALSFSAKVL